MSVKETADCETFICVHLPIPDRDVNKDSRLKARTKDLTFKDKDRTKDQIKDLL